MKPVALVVCVLPAVLAGLPGPAAASNRVQAKAIHPAVTHTRVVHMRVVRSMVRRIVIADAATSPTDGTAPAGGTATPDVTATPGSTAPAGSAAPGGTATPTTTAPPGGTVSPTTTATPTPSAEPGTRRERKRVIGVDAGIFYPSGGKTRDRFGNSWLHVGVGLGAIRAPSVKGRLSVNYSLLYRSRGSNHALIVPIGVQYRRAVKFRPVYLYAGATAGIVFTHLRSVQDNVAGGLRTTPGGSVFVGTTLSNSAFLEARYLAIGQVRGFNLSGISLGVEIRF